ncbi:trichohyalin-like [Temnothorax curvispinosus]|uniref:Trichohyalin-like n=1 Tax=Temnothorax curvispinosus TaxID=300111 RepID=A0A6J1QBC1_9HYME|nr:trichohyalin-like [Temnothorax curvispinosus]
MDKEKEIESESVQQGDKGKKGEGEGEKKARGRPTKAEELAKLRRTDSTGSVKEFFQKSEKRKREEEVEEAANAEEEILKEFNAQRRVNRSPPPKIKKEKQGKENMATEELLEKGLREELRRSEEIWENQRKTLEGRIKNLEEKAEKIEVNMSMNKKEKKKDKEGLSMMNERRREEIQERRQEKSKEIEERRNTPEETRKDEESIKEVDEENIRGNGIREVEGQEKRYIGEEERNDGESEETWKVAFWNVAGLSNKDKDFWEGIKEWDVIVMMETWTDEKGWEKVKEKLPREYRWRVQIAARRNKKGRACGGMLLGIRKSIEEIKERRETEEEGKIEGKIRIGEEVWRIIGIYVNNNIDEKLEGLKERTEEGEKGVRTIIGGDFNARTGEEGGWEEEIERREERGRKSKDKKINKEGRKLLEFIEERGCMILNGGTKGDEEGEYTYTGGRGETVIDYIIGDEEVREKVERLEVGERIDSDHHPLILWVRGSSKRREKLSAIEGKRDLQEEIEEGTRKIRRVIEENEDKNERMTIKNKRGWWDEECTESKREVRKELRKWRKGKGEAERYRERRKEYREMCDRKKKKEKERMIREIGEAKTEGKVWELIGRVRKRRRRVNEEIKPEE